MAGFKWITFYFDPGLLAGWLAGRRKGKEQVSDGLVTEQLL